MRRWTRRSRAAVSAAADRLLDIGHYVETGEAPFDISVVDRARPVISLGGLAWLSSVSAGFSQEASKLIQQFAERGNGLSATDYVGALNSIKCVERQLSLVFESFDLIMTPSAASLPWKAEQAFPGEIAGQPVGPRGHAVFTAFVNLVGSAGINLPCGESGSGLPIGLQLVSRPGGDGLLTGIASQCEAAGLWTVTPPNHIRGLNEALSVLST